MRGAFLRRGRKTLLVALLIGLTAAFGLFLSLGLLAPQEKSISKPIQRSKRLLPLEEKRFVIIVPSYNNSAFVEKNLRSIFTQHYGNFRLIYIDDDSSDTTYTRAKGLIEELKGQKSVTLIRNPTNEGSLANLHRVIHTCEDNEIVVIVDGDDFLAHEGVLTFLNEVYEDKEVWMTYGNYLDYPSFERQEPVLCGQFSEAAGPLRQQPWIFGHLHTFYASLFKQIRFSDLLYRGRCFAMAGDLAFIYPLLEMAGAHVRYVPEVLYLYNRANPLSDHRMNFPFQDECAEVIRGKEPYAPLSALP